MTFGGETRLNDGFGSRLLRGETQVRSGGEWSTRSTPPGMRPRVHPVMAFDAARGRMVLHGGYGYGDDPSLGTMPLAETWEHDGESWVQVPHGPTGFGGIMTYDESRQRVVRLAPRTIGFGTYAAETYEWDGTEWIHKPTTQRPAYSPYWTSLFYVPSMKSVVLHGTVGNSGSQLYQAAFWAFNGSDWRMLEMDAPALPYGAGALSAYDARREVLVVQHVYETYGTWEVRFGHFADVKSYGTGCGAPRLDLQASDAQRPLLGQSARVEIRNSASGLAFVGLGLSKSLFEGLPLPLALDALGMQGCQLLHSFDLGGAYPTHSTQGADRGMALGIPADSALRGLHVYVQAYSLDSEANAAGVLLSNGLDWRLGNE